MAGIESPLPPFYAPPKLSIENLVKLKFLVWAVWNAFCVCILPVKATLYIISTAWNKFAGTPIASREVQCKSVDSKVNPDYVKADASADMGINHVNTAVSDQPSSVPLHQKVSTRTGGLSQQTSRPAGSPDPVQVSNQSQYQNAQQRSQLTLTSQQKTGEINQDNLNAGIASLPRETEQQVESNVCRNPRSEYLVEQNRSRGGERSDQELLQSVFDDCSHEHCLVQQEEEDLTLDLANQPLLQDSDVRQQNVFHPQIQQAILSSIQQSCRRAPVDVPELFVQLPEEGGVREASVQLLHDCHAQQPDTSDLQMQQAILASFQQEPHINQLAAPELVVQLPEEDGVREASVQSLHDSYAQQPDISNSQMQQAILASFQQQPPMTQFAAPELVVQLPQEDHVREATVQSLHDSHSQHHSQQQLPVTQLTAPGLVVQLPEEDDAGVYTHRRLDSSNIQQQDISNQRTPQPILDSSIQKLASVTPSAIPIPVVQLPLRTVLEHVVHENKSRKADQQIYIDNENVREKLKEKEKDFTKSGINVSQIPEEAIQQFISGWKISRDEFYRLYRPTHDPEIVLKLARELVEHVEKERLAQEQEKRAREQEARLAKEVAEAAKLAAKNRLVDAPPEGDDGIFSIRFQTTGGQKITRRFRPRDTVQSIFDFAHINGYPPSAFIFVVGDAPGHRRILDEPLLPLSELQMTNRFVVRIEERE
ncbi:hypothetical protein [Endozoicomonas elysicola]|uniref:UBX domain-containing protein n=1 Tax=Endozoicomonas elysicola TaxID=305900 RepID=A0A081KEN9_9GAMM|nr:hypothetical protein [Endozoicomonas elysicola]KEI72615.1 hypothetical protein GV64_19450 [Endozoicomonas elysicola]